MARHKIAIIGAGNVGATAAHWALSHDLGDVALVGWAAEVFHGLGMATKDTSPARLTLFAGYSNGMIGYLPTAEEHARGGYEVDMAPYFYRLDGRMDPDSGARAAEQSHELLARLFSDT